VSTAHELRRAGARRIDAIEELAASVRSRLVEEAARGDTGVGSDEDLRARIATVLDEEASVLEPDEREELVEGVLSSAVGLGALEPLLSDPSIEEVMVNGLGAVLVERGGRIEPTDVAFRSEVELMHVIERILSRVGRRVDEASPLADARLPDGSRVNCVIPPLSLDGPLLTIRRFRRRAFSFSELVARDTISSHAQGFLARCISARMNVVVSGGTGSGKTTFLNVLSSLIDDTERVITIEDAAELRLVQPHVLRLESRPPNLDGEGEVSMRALVRNALRMRPDRIVVGEVRGREALDMLQALNTGHDGSMTTVHANSPADALRRIETLALMADVALPHAAVREQVASALDLVIHLARDREGGRVVVSIAEVVRVAGDAGVRELFARRGGELCAVAAPSDPLSRRLAVG
jgi:pilus assembly protein CpaF